jgi:uncharacterized membrane protein
MKLLLTYGLALLIFLVLDAVWLGYLCKDFYLSRMESIMLERPRMGAAMLFYTIYVIGLMYFVILPALSTGGWQAAAVNGGLFGFFTYLTYNATAYAVIKRFDLGLAVVDVAWGSFIAATVAALTVLGIQWWYTP